MNEELEQTPKVWTHDDFRDRIIKAVGGHEIGTSELPEEINLSGGPIGDRADAIIKDTTNVELATYGIVRNGKLLILNKNIEGTERSVAYTKQFKWYHVDLLQPQYSKRENLALGMHTHSDSNTPPSATDISLVLVEEETGRSQAEFVLTNNTRYLLIRTIKTPDLPKEKASEWSQKIIQSQVKEAEKRARDFEKHISKTTGISLSEADFNKRLNEELVKIQLRDLYKYTEKYNIALYISTGDNRYSRKAAEEIKRFS